MSGPGLEAQPAGTLVDRALAFLANGPAASVEIAREILGIPRAPGVVAERLAVALLGADPRVRRDAEGNWKLAARDQASPSLDRCTFAVVDVETTGSRPAVGDRITEIAIVGVAEGVAETLVETLVDPGRPIPAAVTRITRITQDMVRGMPAFPAIADDVVAALAGRVFVAHNVTFDWRFVSAEVRRARHVRLAGPSLCTVKLTRRFLPGLKNRGLDSVARYFGVDIENRHRAGGDARATARVLLRLIEAAKDQGAETLADLTPAPVRRRRKRRRAGPTWMDAV